MVIFLLVSNLMYFVRRVLISSPNSFIPRYFHSVEDSLGKPLLLQQKDIHWSKPQKVVSFAPLTFIVLCHQYNGPLQLIFLDLLFLIILILYILSCVNIFSVRKITCKNISFDMIMKVSSFLFFIIRYIFLEREIIPYLWRIENWLHLTDSILANWNYILNSAILDVRVSSENTSRGIFRNDSNIQNEAFNYFMDELFLQNVPFMMLDWVLNTPLDTDAKNPGTFFTGQRRILETSQV